MPQEKKSKLKCYYVTNTTHFSKIAPIKAEEAFPDPYILVFHDVIFESEIELLKNLSRPVVSNSHILLWGYLHIKEYLNYYFSLKDHLC